jgi:hypothetical protein
MKYLSLFTAVLFAVSAHAQTASTSGSVNADHSAQATTAGNISGSASEQANAAVQGKNASASAAQSSNLSAELTKKIDTKHAKVGDEVAARTTSAARLSDGTKLPKGTQLLGKITDVQAKSAEEKASRLAFTFDRAVLRNGSTLPIHATVMSLTAPVSAAAMAENNDSMSPDAAPAPVVSGGGRASGGLLGGGGVAGGALHGVSNTANRVTSTAGNTLRTASGVGATAGEASSVTGQVTNLPGVNFSSSSSANESAVLNAQGRNISLASGTQMTLSVAASH